MVVHERHQLRDLCTIVPGPSGSLLAEMSADIDGVPVITPPDLTDQHTVDAGRIRKVRRGTADSLADRFRLQAGDVVLVRQSATGIGRQALVGEEHAGWLFATSCLRITVTSDLILPGYLRYYLGHAPVRAWLKSRANDGQAVETLTASAVKELPVIVPDLGTQRALADTLDAIDTQVRINTELNRRLDLLGHAVLSDALGTSLG